MSALLADILVVALAARHADVVMPAEKAGQRVRNMRNSVALIKNRFATTNARRVSFTADSGVVDPMPKDHASG